MYTIQKPYSCSSSLFILQKCYKHTIKDNIYIYIDMQAGINFEVLRKGAHSTISVVRMAFYPLDCC